MKFEFKRNFVSSPFDLDGEWSTSSSRDPLDIDIGDQFSACTGKYVDRFEYGVDVGGKLRKFSVSIERIGMPSECRSVCCDVPSLWDQNDGIEEILGKPLRVITVRTCYRFTI